MPTQTLARVIWSLGLAAIAVLVGLSILTSSRTGLEVSPLPRALYAAGLALATIVSGFSVAIPRFLLSDERLVSLIEQGGDPEHSRAPLGRVYLGLLAVRSLLNVTPVAVGFAFAIETLTTAPITPFATLALVAHLLAFPRLRPLFQRIAELKRDEFGNA